MKDGERYYVNYENLSFSIKNCCYKLFFLNQLPLPGGGKDLSGSIRPLPEFSVIEVDLNIAQDEERHFKSNIHHNVDQ